MLLTVPILLSLLAPPLETEASRRTRIHEIVERMNELQKNLCVESIARFVEKIDIVLLKPSVYHNSTTFEEFTTRHCNVALNYAKLANVTNSVKIENIDIPNNIL